MTDIIQPYEGEQLSLIDDAQSTTITLTRGEIESIKGWFESLRAHLPGELVTADYHVVSKLYGAATMMEQATGTDPQMIRNLDVVCKALNALADRVTALEKSSRRMTRSD